MQLKFIHLAAGLVAGIGSMLSCVKIDNELGKEFIPTRHQYDVYTDTIYLEDIRLRNTDRLSGYSSSRITIGAVRDDDFGVTKRGCAFTIIPVDPDMDFGEDPHCTQFHFTAVRDTLSFPDESQEHIIQNVNVRRLTKEIGEDVIYINEETKLSIGERVAPVFTYFGQDSLSFDFNPSFGDEYITAIKRLQAKEKLDSVGDYVKEPELYGIYIDVDEPVGNGGRINMFELPIIVTDSYYIGGNYAELKFRSKYGHRENVDSSFLFFFGAQDMQVYQDTESAYVTPSQTPQSALNIATTDGRLVTPDDPAAAAAAEKLYIEGGSGVKPVISATEIKSKLEGIFAEENIDPEGIIIHKATLVLPYDYDPENYDKMYLYPDRLSPTCRIKYTDDESGKEYYSFAGLTDSSVETENQGDINRSTGCYCPDISHHVQEIVSRMEDEEAEDYDIWMLTMANEIEETSSSDNSALSDYYQNLAYYDYYNSLYNPYGYGGYYGGYYGYGYGYDSYYGMSNYYNYMLAAQYASTQSTTTTSVSTQLDKDRYYHGVLRGPAAKVTDQGGSTDPEKITDADRNVPRIVVTYSVSKTMDK